ncbi:MAG: hypothetical protein ACYTXP_32425 [Nostoc sp.]
MSGLDWQENVKAFPLSSINSNCSSSGEIKNEIISHYIDKKLHPQGDGVFGHREWGMGKKLPMPCLSNAPSDGRSNLDHPLKGIEFPIAFNKGTHNTGKVSFAYFYEL